MKKTILLTLVIAIILGFVMFWYLPSIHRLPSWQYGLREQERHKRIEECKYLSTDELIKLIDSNKDWKNFTGKKEDSKYLIFEEAIKALGSRTDEKALSKLKDIIFTFPEGQKCTAAYAISRSKNKAMVPVLCEALKRHAFYETDDVIVKALVNIDDPMALDCFIQEKDKLAYRSSREAVEKAIEKWSAVEGKQ
jgi:hypothetical protein